MKKTLYLLLIAVLVMFSNNTFADTVVGPFGGWQHWNVSVLNQDGSPYWDGNSSDSAQPYNIGNYLTNTGGFLGGSAPGVEYDYWGTAIGSPNPFDPFSFQWNGGSSQGALKLEVAGYSGSNIFGYFDSTGLHPIFMGGANAGATALFTPTENYGFYLQSPDGLFKTTIGPGDYQHFAIFREAPGVYWIGMEDLKSNSDTDYNDMVVRISSTSVPEPTTILLLGFGLVGLAGVRRKFKK